MGCNDAWSVSTYSVTTAWAASRGVTFLASLVLLATGGAVAEADSVPESAKRVRLLLLSVVALVMLDDVSNGMVVYTICWLEGFANTSY